MPVSTKTKYKTVVRNLGQKQDSPGLASLKADLIAGNRNRRAREQEIQAGNNELIRSKASLYQQKQLAHGMRRSTEEDRAALAENVRKSGPKPAAAPTPAPSTSTSSATGGSSMSGSSGGSSSTGSSGSSIPPSQGTVPAPVKPLPPAVNPAEQMAIQTMAKIGLDEAAQAQQQSAAMQQATASAQTLGAQQAAQTAAKAPATPAELAAAKASLQGAMPAQQQADAGVGRFSPQANAAAAVNPNPLISGPAQDLNQTKANIQFMDQVTAAGPAALYPGRVTPGGVASIQGGGGFVVPPQQQQQPAAPVAQAPAPAPAMTGQQAADAYTAGPQSAPSYGGSSLDAVKARIATLGETVQKQQSALDKGTTPMAVVAEEKEKENRAFQLAMQEAAGRAAKRPAATGAGTTGLRARLSELDDQQFKTVQMKAIAEARERYEKNAAANSEGWDTLSAAERDRLVIEQMARDGYIIDIE